MSDTLQPPNANPVAVERRPSAAWLVLLLLLIGVGAGYFVGELLTQRALTLVLAVATGLLVGAPVALVSLAVYRRTHYVAPVNTRPPTWEAPSQQPIIQINLDDLIQRRAAMTPPPPQYLHLDQADDAQHPARVVGYEEWN